MRCGMTTFYLSVKHFVGNIMGLRAVCLLFVKIWTLFGYMLRKNMRAIIQHQTIKYEIYPLSPISIERLSFVQRKIMVLDLDETLIHSHHDGVARPTVKPSTPPDFILKVTMDRHPLRFYVHKRPHVDYFLDVISQWYDLVIFTAGMEVYGSAVADRLDRNKGLFSRRYYRQTTLDILAEFARGKIRSFPDFFKKQHCKVDISGFSKDLTVISPDLSRIFILDNSPGAYKGNPDNAIPIVSWFADPSDIALLSLLPILDALRFTSDVRSILGRNLHRPVL